MGEFLLIRHGTPQYGLAEERRLRGGARDWVPLSEQGIAEVEGTIERLRGRPMSLVLSSPMTRALQTAAFISRALDLPLAVEFDLHEWLPDLSQSYDTVETAVAAYKEMVQAAGEWPAGETRPWEPLSSVRNRVQGVLSRYAHLPNVAVVCHGTVIAALTGESLPCAATIAYTYPTSFPTAFPPVNALLNRLLLSAQKVLGDQFVGMYIHGSIATGGFDPQRSDIDFLVVTRDELPPEMVSVLEAMHASLTASDLPLVPHYEGSYIPQQALRRYDPDNCLHPALGTDGSFGLDRHGSDWIIQRHLIRERGITLAGPAPQALIDPVTPDDLRRGALGALQEWWAPQLTAPFRLKSSEYQAYAVLTMCRACYTVAHGTAVSKAEAARWAQASLESRWHGLIEQALSWRQGVELACFADALDFIRHTVDRCVRSGLRLG